MYFPLKSNTLTSIKNKTSNLSIGNGTLNFFIFSEGGSGASLAIRSNWVEGVDREEGVDLEEEVVALSLRCILWKTKLSPNRNNL